MIKKMKKTKNPVAGSELGFKKIINNLNDTTVTSQQQRLLVWLKEKSISTLVARQALNIMMPAARVHELRHKFHHNIVRDWIVDFDAAGRPHRVGRYCLLSGTWNGGSKK